MSLLSRLSIVHTAWRGVNKVKSVRSSELCLVPVANLLARPRTLLPKSFSTNVDLHSYGEDVKKYLNYVTDLYRNSKLETDENIGPLLQSQNLQSVLRSRLEIMSNIESLKDLVTDDKEMEELKKEEVQEYQTKLESIDNELLESICNQLDLDTYGRVMLEIVAGVGGSEAMIFANDLLTMYIAYLEQLGLEYQIIECEKVMASGIRAASVLISDKQGFNKIKYEGGVHRVQRVPLTERHGRIHTSTASVAIYPEPSDIQVNILDKDLRIDTMRASGAGGQHVNTTDSAVRILHIPTGVMVTSQQGRSQFKNKEVAMLKLRTLLYEQQLNEQVTSASTLKKQQIGKRTRNEKIRTYNYLQDRITDHRWKDWKVGSLKIFMENPIPLEELQQCLHREMQKNVLLDIIRKSESRLK